MAQVSKLALLAAFDGGGVSLVDLDTPAKDNAYMRPYWQLVDDMLVGVEAMRLNCKTYLPKYPAEENEDYKYRVSVSKFTNVFRDIVEDLSSRPFSEPVKLDDAPVEIEEFADNVDGAGTTLTQFAGDTFFNGVANALDWIFVDFPVVPPNENGNPRTREQDIADGIRPFWSHIRAINVLEVRTAFIGGSETLIYVRLLEPASDDKPDRVRIMERSGTSAWWTLYEKTGVNGKKQSEWKPVEEGVFSIGVIPMVPYSTARRNGRTWQFYPAMKDAADLQVQLYQDESGLKYSKIMSSFVMIAANGVKPEYTGAGNSKQVKPMKTGPGRMLYGGTDAQGNPGSFELLEPSSSSMEFAAKDNERTKNDLRELGRQPLTAQSGNLTVITTTVAAMKGNSACQQWAIMEAVALKNAIDITGLWLNVDTKATRVEVYHDFDVDAEGKDMATLNEWRKGGDLSQESLWDEGRRRGILSGEFTPEREKERLLAETPADDEIDDNVLPFKPPIVA